MNALGWLARACAGKDVPTCTVSGHFGILLSAHTECCLHFGPVIQCALTQDIPDDQATRKLHRFSSKVQRALAAWDAEIEPWQIFYYTQGLGL